MTTIETEVALIKQERNQMVSDMTTYLTFFNGYPISAT